MWLAQKSHELRAPALIMVQLLPAQDSLPCQLIHCCSAWVFMSVNSTKQLLSDVSTQCCMCSQTCSCICTALYIFRMQGREVLLLCACTTASISASSTSLPLPFRFRAAVHQTSVTGVLSECIILSDYQRAIMTKSLLSVCSIQLTVVEHLW